MEGYEKTCGSENTLRVCLRKKPVKTFSVFLTNRIKFIFHGRVFKSFIGAFKLKTSVGLVAFLCLVLNGFCDIVYGHYENSWYFYNEKECCLSAKHHRHRGDFISEFTCGHLYYKTFHLDNGNGYVYVGAMDHIFRLNLSDISQSKCERDSLHLEATDVNSCIINGRSEEYECRNHIRVIQDIGEDFLYLCGTNAYSPRDLIIYKNLKHLPRHVHYGHVGSGAGRCPGAPNLRVATAWVGEPFSALFSGTHVDSTLADRLLVRWDLQKGTPGYRRTARYNTKWLDAPEFIALHVMDEYAYALVRETGSCNQREARIVRVCLNDRGSTRHPRDWTTFTKATLSCNAPHYYQLESIYKIPGDTSRFYGVFTSGTNPVFSGSAICSFTMTALEDAFSGKFRENAGNGGAWQPVPEDKVPKPRPGSCVQDTTLLSDAVVNFIRSHPLMHESVVSEYERPLFVQKDVLFTVFVVDRVSYKNNNYFIYYCGTGTGIIYKIVQWTNFYEMDSFLLDVWTIFPRHEAIEAMVLSSEYKSVYVASNHRIKQFRTDAICGYRYDSCIRCSRDPYCGWNINQDTCEPYREGLFRDVENRSLRGCDDFIHPKHVSATFGQSVLLGSFYELPDVIKSTELTWSRRSRVGADAITIKRSDKFVMTIDQSLVILGLGLQDGGLFECRHGNRLLAVYNLTIDADRCVQPLQNGSYHRIYLDWCRQFLKHKAAMKLWQAKRKEQCQSIHQDWSEKNSNEIY